jgi:glucose/arabinose dehydrogenase
MRSPLRFGIPTFLALMASATGFAQTPPAQTAASQAPAQSSPAGLKTDPFPQPIAATEGVIAVTLREFASLPDIDNIAARLMTLIEEPATRRLFISDMRGVLYAVSPDGKTVSPYLSLLDANWAVPVQSQGRERGLQSFVLHPQFAQAGTPGFGKFYTYADTSNQAPPADFTTPNTGTTHDLVLHEWTAKTPGASSYDGGMPRELIRWRQPFANHNGGAIAFNSTARPGTPDFGLLYIGVGDGGSGGDPMNLSQNLGSAFGKVLRIDPLGKNGRGGKYGIPDANPFRSTTDALPEIFAYGVRNAQRFAWDAKGGAMYLSDIGQNTVEEVSPVSAGANLGWNTWEGSYRFGGGRLGVNTEQPRSDPKLVYPIVEWDQLDPVLLPNNSGASVGVLVYRSTAVPQLTGRLLFGDMPSGELFHVSADDLPKGGQDAIRRVLFRTAAGAEPRRLLDIVQEKNRAQGKTAATRVDMRFDANAAGQIFVLNKADGTLRVIEK